MEETPHKTYAIAVIIASVIIALAQYQKAELVKYQIQQKAQQEQEKAQQEQALQEQQQAEKQTKDILRETCLSNADSNYNTNWASACKTQAVNINDKIQTCISMGGTEYSCRSFWENHTELYGDNCKLMNNADYINQLWQNDKDECFKKYPVK